MRRTLTLGALATASYSLDGVSAFNVPLSVQTRQLSSVARSPCVSTDLAASESRDRGLRPRVATPRMATTGSPVGTSVPKVVEASTKSGGAGGDPDEDGESSDATESPQVGERDVETEPKTPSDELPSSPESEDPFDAAEKEFKEAQERGVEVAKAAEVADKASGDDVTGASANATAKVDEPAAATEKPAVEVVKAVAKDPEKPKTETPGGFFNFGAESLEEFFGITTKPRVEPSDAAKKESKEIQEPSVAVDEAAEVADEATGDDVAVASVNVTAKVDEPAAATEEPAVEVVKAATKDPEEPKPETPEPEAPGGFFNFGAESLEEFFGITTKPRLVASDKPVPDEADASGLPKLDASAVDSMVKEKGLNEVTLKEDFRTMEAEAKATQETKEESEKPVDIAKGKAKEAEAANPFAGFVSMFSPETDVSPSGKPAATKVDAKPEAAPEVPDVEIDVATAKEKAPSGLAAMFEGMFAPPVLDDKEEVAPPKPDPVPSKTPPAKVEKPVATPAAVKAKAEDTPNPFASLAAMFSPEPSTPAPASDAEVDATSPAKAAMPKAASRPAVSAKKEEPAAVPKAEVKAEKKDSGASPGVGGLFSGMFVAPVYDDEIDTLPKKANSPRAMPVFAPPPTPTKAASKKPRAPTPVAPKKAATPTPSFLDSLFGSARSQEKTSATASKPSPPSSPPKAKPSIPATKTAVPRTSASSANSRETASKPAFDVFGMFGAATEKTKPTKPAGGSSVSTSSPPRKAPAASQKKVTAVVKPPAPSPAPSPSLIDFFGGSKSKGTAPVAKEPKPKPQKKSPSPSLFGGFLGGSGSGGSSGVKTATKPKPKRPPAPKPVPPPLAPVVSRVKTMDDAFLRKVSVMLRRNQAQIKKFQQLTDRFRGGLIKAVNYYEGVQELFGEENVEEIIGPLLAALPENDKRKALQTVYNKAQKAKSDAAKGEGAKSSSGAGLNLFGWGAKPSRAPAPAPAPTLARSRSSTSAGAGIGSGAAGGDPYAFAAAKLSAANFQLFKARTQLYGRGGINARNYYDTLVKVFGKDGVSAQFPAVLKALPSNKRKLLQDVYSGLNN